MRSLVAAGLLVLPVSVVAAGERVDWAERRRAVETRFQAEQAACAGRFAVTACLEAARLKRRDDLVALQKAEAAAATAERRAAAQGRSEAASAPVAPQVASAPPPPSPPLRARPAARPASAAPEPVAGSAASGASGSADRALAEQRTRAAYERRLQEAEAHQRAVERRNQQRPSKAAPLPVPGPAASASR